MKKITSSISVALVALGMLAAVPSAGAANCNAAVSSAIAQTGGKLISVSTRQSGGQTICVVTLSVQDQSGKPPRLVTREIKQ